MPRRAQAAPPLTALPSSSGASRAVDDIDLSGPFAELNNALVISGACAAAALQRCSDHPRALVSRGRWRVRRYRSS
jgi:hypothetical protein